MKGGILIMTVKVKYKGPMSEEEKAFIRKHYPNKEYTVKEICEAIDRSKSAVTAYANSIGLSREKTKMPKASKPGHKICTGCGNELPLEAYTRNKNKYMGVEERCKACRKLAEIKKKEEKAKQAIKEKTLTRKCTVCGEEKELNDDNFSWQANRKVYASECKVCNAKRMKAKAEKSYRENGYKK